MKPAGFGTDAVDYDDADMALACSKAGRMRKVATFAGAKRKVGGGGNEAGGFSFVSAPAALAAHGGDHSGMGTDSEAFSDEEDGDEDDEE